MEAALLADCPYLCFWLFIHLCCPWFLLKEDHGWEAFNSLWVIVRIQGSQLGRGRGQARRGGAKREALLFLAAQLFLFCFKGCSFPHNHPGTAHPERIVPRLLGYKCPKHTCPWPYLGPLQLLSNSSDEKNTHFVLLQSSFRRGTSVTPIKMALTVQITKPELGHHSTHQWQLAESSVMFLWLLIGNVPWVHIFPETPEQDVCDHWARLKLKRRWWFTPILLGDSYASIYHERQTSSRFTIRFWTLSLKSIS